MGVDCGACLCVCVVLRSGGCELLFNKQKEHDIDTPESVVTMKDLIAHVRDHMLAERPDLFVSGDTVRPGILVLVNDTDWELLGGLDYRIEAKDNVVFISTLHGG